MKVSKRNIIALILLVCSFVIVTYQVKYSESAKINKNLKDFDNAESFFSSDVNQTDIKKIDRKGNNYSFTIEDVENIEKLQKLGKVYMVDKNGNVINAFNLFKQGGKYVIYMRGIYMSVN